MLNLPTFRQNKHIQYCNCVGVPLFDFKAFDDQTVHKPQSTASAFVL